MASCSHELMALGYARQFISSGNLHLSELGQQRSAGSPDCRHDTMHRRLENASQRQGCGTQKAPFTTGMCSLWGWSNTGGLPAQQDMAAVGGSCPRCAWQAVAAAQANRLSGRLSRPDDPSTADHDVVPRSSQQRLPRSRAPAAAEGASGAQRGSGASQATSEYQGVADCAAAPPLPPAARSLLADPFTQALAVRCSAAASSETLPQSLQTLVSAFQAVPDPMAVRRRRCRRRHCQALLPLHPELLRVLASPPAPAHTCCNTVSSLTLVTAAPACPPLHGLPLQRYKQLLFYATKLEPFPVEQHTEENKVKGCVSQVRSAPLRRACTIRKAASCFSWGSGSAAACKPCLSRL